MYDMVWSGILVVLIIEPGKVNILERVLTQVFFFFKCVDLFVATIEKT